MAKRMQSAGMAIMTALLSFAALLIFSPAAVAQSSSPSSPPFYVNREYRFAIIFHDAHGLSNPEIAELLGCSLATAKIRVHRARARLRETLDAACSFEIDERGVLVCDPVPDTPTPDTA